MNRRILIQVTLPAVAIGILLLGACLASTCYVNRLQTNLARILNENLISQGAAHDLEIQVRRLRFHSLLYLVEPTPELEKQIKKDHNSFEKALQLARESGNTADEQYWVRKIEEGYRKYHSEIDPLLAIAARDRSQISLAKLADTHPVEYVVTPSQELLQVNKEMTERTSQESQRVAQQAQWTMILLGLLGPAGGLIVGYGIARGLSRSIYQLSVRVRDMAHRLDQDVASVSIEADGDLNILDRQLQHVVRQVEEVTERQQRHQREMLRAEQLATVGQLAAGVAHEVRNPLTSVKMLVEVALLSDNRKPLSLDDLRVIHREIGRLEQTIQGLLDFARLPAPQRSICDMRDVVAQALELVRARARQQKVEISFHSPEATVRGNVDRGQLRTVLVNLFLNALDAMPLGGHLKVSLDGSSPTGVRLVVLDTGSGIPPEIIERLFTPFVTTKPTGTGLGLSVSRRIVEEHGGQLVAANRGEGGASFTISLPPSHDRIPTANGSIASDS